MDNPWVTQKPINLADPSKTNHKQVEFVTNFDRECLLGGAGGGGKSSGILMAAAQFVEIKDYAALILRRTFADLSKPGALLDRSMEWWRGTAARWNSQNHTWTFPSGARIAFGYLENDRDKYQYQSSEFQFIGFDELTQFVSSQYTYMFTRLRRNKTSEIPLRMRGGTNPGGIGHEFVKKRFITPGPDRKTYIRALLTDNPYLDQEEYIASLMETDPITRAQMLAGDWDDFAGGRFLRAWMRYYTRTDRWYDFGADRIDMGEITNVFLTVDTAATVAETVKPDPDWTVIHAWATARVKGQTYLIALGCVRDRMEVPEIPARVAGEYLRWGAGRAIIEGGGTQKGVVQLCRRFELPGKRGMNIVEYMPGTKDLLSRAAAITNACQAGRVWLPASDPTYPLDDVTSELFRFTGDPKRDGHDDIVSAWSMAGHEFAGRGPAMPMGGFKAQTVWAGVGAFR